MYETPMKQTLKLEVRIPESVQLGVFHLILTQGDVVNGRNMVELIKYVRSEMIRLHPGMHVGLKEAKDYCDEVRRRLQNWSYNV